MKEEIFQDCLKKWLVSDGHTEFWRELADKWGYPSSESLRQEFKYIRRKKGIKKDSPIVSAPPAHGAKILLFDIETTPILAFTWGLWDQNISAEAIVQDWHLLSWSAKWIFSDEIMSMVLTPEEAKKHDDKRILSGIWSLLNESDIIVGHNCVEQNTPILKADLTWVPAGSLVEGDEIVGFEEDSHEKNQARKFEKSFVTSNSLEERECFEVTFDNGDSVICTPDHKWLKLAANGRDYRWCETRNMSVGQRVEKFFNPWEVAQDFNSGWLSGFISGEGTLKVCGSGIYIDICQRPGSTWDQAISICEEKGIETGKLRVPGGGLGKGDTNYVGFIGGKMRQLEIIGSLQIKRFIEKIDFDKMGSLKSKHSNTATITSIKFVGKKSVAILSTSSKTYFGGGYPMHNCDQFDTKKLNTRFLINGMLPPRPSQSIDTLKVAKLHFAFTSNKLDFINEVLGLPQKEDTDLQLWIDCYNGDADALKKMESYNRNDVDILEDNYLKVRPYIKGHPNLNLWNEENVSVCPNCGSEKIVWGGKYYTYTGYYQAFTCSHCGAHGRDRKLDTPKEKRATIVR